MGLIGIKSSLCWTALSYLLLKLFLFDTGTYQIFRFENITALLLMHMFENLGVREILWTALQLSIALFF